MNEPSLTADRLTQHPVAPITSFYQKLVLQAFAKMTSGFLQVYLPDGTVTVFGSPKSEPNATIKIKDAGFFKRCVLFGDVGFAESYLDGEWETDSIKSVIAWAIANVQHAPGLSGSKAKAIALNLLKIANRLQHLLRPNNIRMAQRNIAEHYDLGNDFYELWLDSTMTYSSACFSAPDQSLADAQAQKYESLCQKLRLKTGDHVLEIGSGWGGFACHAVKNYGVKVTTFTISKEQHDFAKNRFVREGVSAKAEVRLQDYRTIDGVYDKVVSIEMMEALGDRYLETYCATLHSRLAPDGLVGLQYITVPDCRHAELKKGVDFIQKHIFPGSLLLSVGRVNQAMNRTGDLFLHHLEDLGSSYAQTLQEWWRNFNSKIDDVRAQGFDERFIRKWNYYLQYCEAAFESRNISVVQAIYTRPNNLSLR